MGLSVAWRLAELAPDVSITVIETGPAPGPSASWAGAGILEPAGLAAGPYERLMAQAAAWHASWSERLEAQTGIANGYRRCGGWLVAQTADQIAELDARIETLRSGGVDVWQPGSVQRRELEPTLAGNLAAAWLSDSVAQIRNPRHLAALRAAVTRAGVRLISHCPVGQVLTTAGGRVRGVQLADGATVTAGVVVVAAGAWSQQLLTPLSLHLWTRPIRGQIVLLKWPTAPLGRIVEVGPRYVVPRDDGHVLIGSTLEDAGFEVANTPRAIAELEHFARDLVPALAQAPRQSAWAGLRPGQADGWPYVGASRRCPGLWVAAGHYRHGLQLSTATAEFVAAGILTARGGAPAQPTAIDWAAADPDRHSDRVRPPSPGQ